MSVDIRRIAVMDTQVARQLEPVFDALGEGQRWDMERGQAFLAHPDNGFWVASVDGQVAGFTSAHKLLSWDGSSGEVLLYDLAVAEGYRRQGVGKALVDAVKGWAREEGVDEMWVLTERDNEPAMATYRSTQGMESSDDTVMFTYQMKTDVTHD